MKKLMILTVLAIVAFAVSTASAQQSKADFKGTAENSTGLKFSDWDLTLYKNSPVSVKTKVVPGNAHSFNFKAKKGQKISVTVAAKILTSFVVYENWENGGQIGESASDEKSWQHTFANDGDYKIVLSADEKSNYTITVKIY